MAGVTHAHFSFDNWTSRGHENYLVLCAHFVTKEWKLVDRVLNFVKYSARHDFMSIRETVMNLTSQALKRFGSDNVTV
jgi:hypothetical protein